MARYLTINEDIFYPLVRKSVFRGRISKAQFDGMRRLIAIWGRYYSHYPIEELAYNLSTAKGETGNMQPIKEKGKRSYFNKYDIRHNPKKARELGNVNPGDGFKFRGEGHVQNTGRRNARFSSRRLREEFGFDVDFEKTPSLRGNFLYSAHCLFMGNHEGWWTGKKLSDYSTWHQKRRVVNGKDRWMEFGEMGRQFMIALDKAVVWVDEWPDELNELVGMPGPKKTVEPAKGLNDMLKMIGNIVGIGSAGGLLSNCQQLQDLGNAAAGSGGNMSIIGLVGLVLLLANGGSLTDVLQKFAGWFAKKDEAEK